MTDHPETTEALLIGVGNEFREDDAVGLCIAREIRRRNAGAVTVREVSGDCSALMDAWAGARQVIIVDAMFSGAVPGSIRRFDATCEEVPRRYFHYSTHAFGVAEAIETARRLDTLPPHLVLYGVEGKEFGTGVGLSDPVVKSVPILLAMIEEDLHAFHAV